ncbi:MAG TPA: hypothetical protein VMS55_12110 [Myxococcota bacterium]|nr:hypothetical protein [Myxococcota bacterium]
MPPAKSVILLELNELTPKLMFRFIEEGHLPHFARLFSESKVFTTDAEEAGFNLNPWIQWVTVHSGVPFSEHGVFLLGEGQKVESKGLVDLVSDAGKRVWMCGSMNVRFQTPLCGAALPDPWAADIDPYPLELLPYFRFVRHHVQEHTNEESRLGLRDQLAFARFMAGHGLRPSTVWQIARQLLDERSGRNRWKRVAILDRLQWDLFHWYYRRLQPHLATFFLNSVAHLQHTHWRELEPDKFKLKPSPAEQAEFEQAILFGYRENDRLVGKFLELAGDDTTIVFCSALSQQPDVRWEDKGGRVFYRPRNFDALVAFAGITAACKSAPVMSEEFWLEFQDEAAAREAGRRLADLGVGEHPAFRVDVRGTEVYAGCAITSPVPGGVMLTNRASGRSVRFFELLYQADTVKSGVHHRDGLLWIRTPDRRHAVHLERVPLTSIAPTVLGLLDVPVPSYMQGKPLL